MIDIKLKGRKDESILPDWLGRGQDLFETIQIIKGKKINKGFLVTDTDFKFGEAFSYPIIFEIKSTKADIESSGIAFRIGEEVEAAKKTIDESFIIPVLCRVLRPNNFVNFFADVVEKDVDFAFYINKTPKEFRDIKIYRLNEIQKIIFDEHLILEITEVLDKRTNVQSTSGGLNKF